MFEKTYEVKFTVKASDRHNATSVETLIRQTINQRLPGIIVLSIKADLVLPEKKPPVPAPAMEGEP